MQRDNYWSQSSKSTENPSTKSYLSLLQEIEGGLEPKSEND